MAYIWALREYDCAIAPRSREGEVGLQVQIGPRNGPVRSGLVKRVIGSQPCKTAAS